MTTVNSMNYLLEKNSAQISVKVPQRMKVQIEKNAKKLKMIPSIYMKLAISERLEKDASNETNK